jgi:hypothetical protein
MSDFALAVGTSTSPEKYQSKTSATPSFESATYPSSDIDMSATTLAMVQLLPGQRLSDKVRSESRSGENYAGRVDLVPSD